jgi:hypothetical protein
MTSKRRTTFTQVKRGDPDPTPPSGKFCGEPNRKGYTCTRRAHTDMPHVAGNGEIVLAVWFT